MDRELFNANLDVLKEKLPDGVKLAAQLRNHRPARAALTGRLDDGTLNIELDGKPLYSPDALTAASVQVDAYLKNPDRYLMDLPSSRQDPGTLHSEFRKELYGALDQWDLNREPTPDAGYLVSLGAGGGIHIPLILQNVDIRNLVLVEPDRDMFWCCLHILPWEGLFHLLESRGGSARIICEQEAEVAANWTLQALRGVDHCLVDGSYIYQSRPEDPVMCRIAETLKLNLATLASSMGFFEDECLMFRNTAENLLRHSFRLMGPGAITPKSIPAMVVGSGPSVDTSMESIKRNADKTVVISGGTAITVLKRNDVQPDFHTQYENVAMNYELLAEVRGQVGFDNVVLIAPTTVDPRIPDLFEDCIFYFRDTVCPTKLFVDIADMVPLSGPTVTNLACRAGVSFGITEFLLYGVDLGGPEPETHHSKESIYEYSSDLKMETTGQTMQEIALSDPMNIPVKGNRRERVFTSRVMVLARMFFEKLFSTISHIKAYNCSDGVHIEGAAPVDPDQLTIAPGLVSKETLKKAVLEELPSYEPGNIFSRDLSGQFHARVIEIFDAVLEYLGDGREGDFLPLYDRIRPLLQQGQEELAHGVDPAARILPSGTFMILLQTGYFLYRRLENAEQKRQFMLAFCDCMTRTVQDMREQADEIIGNYV